MGDLNVGAKLKSAVCTTEVIVVRLPEEGVDLRCGGVAMALAGEDPVAATLDPDHSDGTLLGKRYADPNGLEVLCTKAGEGSLSLGTEPLRMKEAKPLPSSD